LSPATAGAHQRLASASALFSAAEILGRYLFFVSVVPKHMAAPYLPEVAAA
jgi:hypothetical protein